MDRGSETGVSSMGIFGLSDMTQMLLNAGEFGMVPITRRDCEYISRWWLYPNLLGDLSIIVRDLMLAGF